MVTAKVPDMSPSARKVWIEIDQAIDMATKELSPSARKVWIEIGGGTSAMQHEMVAFRKEGVD